MTEQGKRWFSFVKHIEGKPSIKKIPVDLNNTLGIYTPPPLNDIASLNKMIEEALPTMVRKKPSRRKRHRKKRMQKKF